MSRHPPPAASDQWPHEAGYGRPHHVSRSSTGPIVEAVRLLVTLTTTAAGYLLGESIVTWTKSDTEVASVVGAVVGAGVGYVGGGVLGRLIKGALREAPKLVSRATGPELFAGAFGFALGVLVGVVMAVPMIVFLPAVVGWPSGGLLVLLLSSFGGRVFAERSRDLLSAVGLRPSEPVRTRLPVPEHSPGYVVDSAAAIDGRILDLARAGLMTGPLQVPAFVIDELQAIADAGDKSRRRRGRRGLDILDALRDVDTVEMTVPEDTVPEFDEVDAKLLALSDRSKATLVTTDHNLGKAAELRGISVLNPHSLGESLRPAIAVGDQVDLTIEKEGSEPGQGVGFLEDGTMVVVEGGADRLGDTVRVEVSNSLRTSVGRLMFARMEA